MGVFLLLLKNKAVTGATNLHCFLPFLFGFVFIKGAVVLLVSPILSHFYFLQNQMLCTGINLLYRQRCRKDKRLVCEDNNLLENQDCLCFLFPYRSLLSDC